MDLWLSLFVLFIGGATLELERKIRVLELKLLRVYGYTGVRDPIGRCINLGASLVIVAMGAYIFAGAWLA